MKRKKKKGKQHPALDGSTLVLVTCYPFRYSGHAPGKYMVTAQLVE